MYRNVSVGQRYSSRDGRVSALKYIRETDRVSIRETDRVSIRDPASCEHLRLSDLNNG